MTGKQHQRRAPQPGQVKYIRVLETRALEEFYQLVPSPGFFLLVHDLVTGSLRRRGVEFF
jgi:hypothetical protein